ALASIRTATTAGARRWSRIPMPSSASPGVFTLERSAIPSQSPSQDLAARALSDQTRKLTTDRARVNVGEAVHWQSTDRAQPDLTRSKTSPRPALGTALGVP